MVADKEKDKETEDLNAEGGEGVVTEEEVKGFGKKQILLFIVLPLIVLIGVGAGLYFGGFIGGHAAEEVAKTEETGEAKKSTGIFYDLPDIIVNLSTAGRKPRFLKISASMELAKQEDVAAIEKLLPRVLDHFQTYLRELREEDLRGSSGIYRLRLELLARVNAAANPIEVNDILFREILVQ